MIQAGTQVSFQKKSPITKEQLKAYADASGDQNPIHQDETHAKKAGLPGIIAHGMLTAGFLCERALEFAREQGMDREFRLKRFQTRFKAMTLLGDVISLGGVVKEAGQDFLVLDLQAKNQRDEITTAAQARFERT